MYNDLCASMWFTYMLIFLEKVVRISHEYAGFLLLVGQVTDGLATPLVGYETDQRRFRTMVRYGQRKSWHLLGTKTFNQIWHFLKIFRYNSIMLLYLKKFAYISILLYFLFFEKFRHDSYYACIPFHVHGMSPMYPNDVGIGPSHLLCRVYYDFPNRLGLRPNRTFGLDPGARQIRRRADDLKRNPVNIRIGFFSFDFLKKFLLKKNSNQKIFWKILKKIEKNLISRFAFTTIFISRFAFTLYQNFSSQIRLY